MEWTEWQWIESFGLGEVIVLWLALAINLVLPIPRDAHPVRLWHKFATQLADKVNTSDSVSQATISGSLAWAVMILPTWLLLWAIKPLIWQPLMFELAILLLALDWKNLRHFAIQATELLSKDDRAKARLHLNEWQNRETQSLSAVGIGKAAAETLIIGSVRHIAIVIFWYVIGGATLALLYRLASELARAWTPNHQQNIHFGKPAAGILFVLDYIPTSIFSWFVIVGRQASLSINNIQQQAKTWPNPTHAKCLIAIGSKLSLSLGGPAIYQGRKKIRTKLGGRIAPSAIHIDQIQSILTQRLIIWTAVFSAIQIVISQGF